MGDDRVSIVFGKYRHRKTLIEWGYPGDGDDGDDGLYIIRLKKIFIYSNIGLLHRGYARIVINLPEV